MSEPTKGLRLEFEEGICGLKFVADERLYPEANGPSDMAYINRLIEADERRRHLEALDRYVATHADDAIGKAMMDMHLRGTGYTRFTSDGKLEHVPWNEMRKSEEDERRHEKTGGEPKAAEWDGSPEGIKQTAQVDVPLPINRALVRPLSFCNIPLWRGSVTVQNNSPDPIVVTVDRATIRAGEQQ
jgi:hypothetical protein